MKIQSLSVVVPPVGGGKCINDCRFCVAKMKPAQFANQIEGNLRFYDLYRRQYIERLAFARDNGCNTVMLTGDCEPQQNRGFLIKFSEFNAALEHPFRNIEMQTTGVTLDEGYLRFLRNTVGVSTVSVSVSDLFDEANNRAIIGAKSALNVEALCQELRRYDFNIRLSLNLSDSFSRHSVAAIFDRCRALSADQVTFRVLYSSYTGSEQDQWIEAHRAPEEFIAAIEAYIEGYGQPFHQLEYGALQYDVQGMSVVVDKDCMSKEITGDYKYLILQPNCKLYSQWDMPASLIF